MKPLKYSLPLLFLALFAVTVSASDWPAGDKIRLIAINDSLLTDTPDSVAVEDFDSLQNRSSRYERIVRRYHKFWMGMVPSHIKVQYAGSIGLFSIGMGWHYGGRQHRKWETDLQFGYLPRYHRRTGNFILTARESYIPFRVRLGDNLDIEPLSCGLFFSSIFGEEYWREQPSRYPRKYYGFSTSIRANVFPASSTSSVSAPTAGSPSGISSVSQSASSLTCSNSSNKSTTGPASKSLQGRSFLFSGNGQKKSNKRTVTLK